MARFRCTCPMHGEFVVDHNGVEFVPEHFGPRAYCPVCDETVEVGPRLQYSEEAGEWL